MVQRKERDEYGKKKKRSRGEEDSREVKLEKTEEAKEGRGIREGIPKVERKRNKDDRSPTVGEQDM